MIEVLVPPDVSVSSARRDGVGDTEYPDELVLVEKSVESRQAEFRTTRHCARRALAELGVPPGPILRGPRGEPRWPPGFVGSMTHCAGFRAAVAGLESRYLAMGIDAEPNAPLPPGVLDLISTTDERRALANRADFPIHLDRLLFSAKESVFKAWYPVNGTELAFGEVTVRFDPNGTFDAELSLEETPFGGSMAGRWGTDGRILSTAVVVRAP